MPNKFMKIARAQFQPPSLSFSLLFLLIVSSQAVKLQVQDKYPRDINESHSLQVVMDNELLQVTISNPQGIVTGIKFSGIDNLLEVRNPEFDRGYWDLVWSEQGTKGTKGTLDRIEATNFTVIVEKEEQVELSFSRIWNSSLEGEVVPLNIDKRFIMLRGSSGFYSYAIFEYLDDWPPFNIDNIRMAFKLNQDK
ncbi:hypothetical protein Patl1_08699 [Pistacia atlantica]|uniref:Uncharacterized protein n=1 Tax=Pistacia atlantica TaxID=434234 RepID=A0ACC1AFE2_9ROSI|nr:hypothetical protein Patl1_08699 [Pistacia atlantica]